MLIVALLSQAALAQAVDWPQWRGPTRDGILPAKCLALTQLPSQPRVVWKIKSGEGLSSPVVTDGTVFHFENRGGKETMVALSAMDGSQKWSTSLAPVFEDGQGPRGPRCTPVVEGGQVFAQCSRGTLHCLNAKDGKVQWELDYAQLGMKFIGEKGRAPGAKRHGFTCAPLVIGNAIYITVGGKGAGIVCIDKDTGKTIWSSLDYQSGYAPPIPATLAGRQQFVCFFVEGAVGVDVRNGEELWKVPLTTDYGRHVAAPTVHGDTVVVGSHQVGLLGIGISGDGENLESKQLWKNIEAQPNISHGVQGNGHYFGIGDPAKLVCVDISTGKARWSDDSLFFPDPKRAMATLS